MRQTANEILHGFGYFVFAIGFLMCGETLLSVTDPFVRANILRYAVCGLMTVNTGLFLTSWNF